jgi:uncharacterized membrane protein
MKYRIGPTQKVFMMAIAILFDLVEFILTLLAVGIIINRIITVVEYFIYILWFSINRVFFFQPKTMKRLGGTFIAEIFPVIGALPMFSVGVHMTIKQSRLEDLENFNNKNIEKWEKKIVRLKQKRG